MIVPGCPSDLDERIELYCLHRLSQDEERKFEEHLTVCPACLSEVFDTDLFLDSLISALKECEGVS
jgi:hypothetical protein